MDFLRVGQCVRLLEIAHVRVQGVHAMCACMTVEVDARCTEVTIVTAKLEGLYK